MTRVKICCIADLAEANLAIAAGAYAIGLVSKMPSGPGPISEDQITHIAANVPASLKTFLLTCLQDVDAIVAQHRRCRTTTIQLVDAIAIDDYVKLHDALPDIDLVQVIHVLDESAIDEAITIAPHVHAILLDSGNPKLAIKQLGGTGRTHNWAISRRIVEAVNIPVYLAGGLRVDNVADAIAQVRPFGVDLCSGVRTAGKLDPEKLHSFFAAVHSSIQS